MPQTIFREPEADIYFQPNQNNDPEDYHSHTLPKGNLQGMSGFNMKSILDMEIWGEWLFTTGRGSFYCTKAEECNIIQALSTGSCHITIASMQ